MSEHGCGSNGGCCGGASHDSGGCGGCGGGCGGGTVASPDKNPLEVTITPQEEQFLEKLAQSPFLPVAMFLLRHLKDANQHMSLAPVYLETGTESLEEVKMCGQILLGLEDKNIVSLDYDSPLEGSDPSIFQTSQAFARLSETVTYVNQEEPDSFAPPEIVYGSVGLTAIGDLVLEQLRFT